MVVISKNQKSGLKRTCIDCKHMYMNGSTRIEDKDRCVLWYKLNGELKNINNAINGIPEWCPFNS